MEKAETKITHSKIIGVVTMTDYWPKGLDPRQFDKETREAIKFHEELRQISVRVAQLEKKK